MSTGFTNFTPTSPSGEGSGFVGAGTRKIFVSSSTGNDSNTGTRSSPVATIAHAKTLLRNNSPDWILFLCGDVWNEEYGTNNNNGVSVTGVLGGIPGALQGDTITGAMLISSYDVSGNVPGVTGALPKFNVNVADDSAGTWLNNNGSYVAMVGLEIYGNQRDPTSGSYDPTKLVLNGGPTTAFGTLSSTQWQLYEANKVSFLESGCTFIASYFAQGIPPTLPLQFIGTLILRRNIFYSLYNTVTDNQACYIFGVINLVIDQNVLDTSGWMPALFSPSTVTFNIGTSQVTWSGSKFANDASIVFPNNGDTLPTGISHALYQGTPTYFVVNKSGDTFQVSATKGGSPISFSGSQSGTHQGQWVDVGPTLFSQGFYLSGPDPFEVVGSAGVTLTIGNPTVLNVPAGNFWLVGQRIKLQKSNLSSLAHIPNNTILFITSASASSIQFSTTKGGTPINTTGDTLLGTNTFIWMEPSLQSGSDTWGIAANSASYPGGYTNITGNIIANVAANGIQAREGGTISDNFFVQNYIQYLTTSISNNTTVTNNNVCLQARDFGPNTGVSGGNGININALDGQGPIVSTSELIVHDASTTNSGTAYSLFAQGTPISQNNSLSNSIIYDYVAGISDGSGGTAFSQSGNIIDLLGNNTENYPDPTRTAATYMQALGTGSTLSDFLSSSRSNTINNYQNQYNAHAINNYIRQGFGINVVGGTMSWLGSF